MIVTLRFLSSGAANVPSEPVVMKGEILTIGRAPENDLVLEDPDRTISKRHCVIENRGGNLSVVDTSTNGTFLNASKTPLGHLPSPLMTGDVLALGPYELVVEITGGAPQMIAPPLADEFLLASPKPMTLDSISPVDGFGQKDDFLEALVGGFVPPAGHSQVQRGSLGDDGMLSPSMLANSVLDVHTPFLASPAVSPALVAPQSSPMLDNMPVPVVATGASLIPENWDDLLAPAPISAPPQPGATPAAMSPPLQPFSAHPPLPQPLVSVQETFPSPIYPVNSAAGIPPLQPFPGPSSPSPSQISAGLSSPAFPQLGAHPMLPGQQAIGPESSLLDPFGPAQQIEPSRAAVEDLFSPQIPSPRGNNTPLVVKIPSPLNGGQGGGVAGNEAPIPRAAERNTAPPIPGEAELGPAVSSLAPVPEPKEIPAVSVAVSTLYRDVITGFFAAMGVQETHFDDDQLPLVMYRLGEVLKIMIVGVRDILMTRSMIKSGFNIEQTMIGAERNNPLKFSVTPEQAIETMIKPQVKGYLDGPMSAREALKDIKAHEVSMVTGMEAAIKGLLRRLEPEELKKQVDAEGISLLKRRKERYWEVYEEAYAAIVDQIDSNFHEIFGREFASAYRQQLKKLKQSDL